MFGRISLVAGLSLLLLVAAACDEGGYSNANQNQGPSGPVTGLLLVRQTLEGETVDLAHSDVKTWNVVDQAGTKLFGKDQIGPEFQKLRGVLYGKKRDSIIREGRPLHLGKNFMEVRIIEVRISGEEKSQTVNFVVGPAEATELRGLSNLSALVRRCNIAILLGKIGQ